MATWSASVLTNVHRSQPETISTEPPATRACAVLLLCRKLIESAFLDATRMRNGKPTEVALAAEEWLHAKTDWTLRRPVVIPDAATRAEFAGSFEWACRWLGEHPDHVRQHGLPPLLACIPRHKSHHKALTSRLRCEGGRCGQKHLKGLPAVYAIRERKAASARMPQAAPTHMGEDHTGSPAAQRRGSTAQCLRVRPSLRVIGNHLDARYEAYATYCEHYLGIAPMMPQLWRLHAG